MKKAISLLLITFFFIPKSNAFTAMNFQCPQKLIVKVKDLRTILDTSGDEKVEVNFEVLDVIKGEQALEKRIKIIKGGPDKFVVGQIYTAEFNDQWLCKTEEHI